MKTLRRSKGLTQKELSDIVGVTQVYISKLECGGGANGLTIGKLRKISRALDICPAELLKIIIECSKKYKGKCYLERWNK